MYCGYLRECPCSLEMSTEVCRDKGHDSANNSQIVHGKYFVVCVCKDRQIRYGKRITISDSG